MSEAARTRRLCTSASVMFLESEKHPLNEKSVVYHVLVRGYLAGLLEQHAAECGRHDNRRGGNFIVPSCFRQSSTKGHYSGAFL